MADPNAPPSFAYLKRGGSVGTLVFTWLSPGKNKSHTVADVGFGLSFADGLTICRS
jgi:hypothetical protein